MDTLRRTGAHLSSCVLMLSTAAAPLTTTSHPSSTEGQRHEAMSAGPERWRWRPIGRVEKTGALLYNSHLYFLFKKTKKKHSFYFLPVAFIFLKVYQRKVSLEENIVTCIENAQSAWTLLYKESQAGSVRYSLCLEEDWIYNSPFLFISTSFAGFLSSDSFLCILIITKLKAI